MSNVSQGEPYIVGPYIVKGKLPDKPIYFGVRELTRESVVLKRNNPKVCHDGHPDADSISKRVLKHERSIMAMLEHPYICSPLGYISHPEEQGGSNFLILPHRGDHTLADADGPQHAQAIGPALAQVSVALKYSHSRGVVHRDIKPANIMVHDGKIKIADVSLF